MSEWMNEWMNEWIQSVSRMIRMGKLKCSEKKTWTSVILSSTCRTWSGLGSNPGLRGETSNFVSSREDCVHSQCKGSASSQLQSAAQFYPTSTHIIAIETSKHWNAFQVLHVSTPWGSSSGNTPSLYEILTDSKVVGVRSFSVSVF